MLQVVNPRKDCCKGKDTEARSCNDHDCFDGIGVYGEADEYAYLQYGNGDDLGDFLGKYNLDPPKLPGTTSKITLVLFLVLSIMLNNLIFKYEISNTITSLSLITPEATPFCTTILHEEMFNAHD